MNVITSRSRSSNRRVPFKILSKIEFLCRFRGFAFSVNFKRNPFAFENLLPPVIFDAENSRIFVKIDYFYKIIFLPRFIFSVSIFEMLIIEFIIFDSGLTFLWFWSSIFSFRSVRLFRLSWFWRSLVRPFLKLRSASNFKLLYLTTRTAFYSILSSVFIKSISVFKAFFTISGFYQDFQGKFWSISAFWSIFNLSKMFLGLREKFFETKCEWDLFYFESDNQNKDDWNPEW